MKFKLNRAAHRQKEHRLRQVQQQQQPQQQHFYYSFAAFSLAVLARNSILTWARENWVQLFYSLCVTFELSLKKREGKNWRLGSSYAFMAKMGKWLTMSSEKKRKWEEAQRDFWRRRKRKRGGRKEEGGAKWGPLVAHAARLTLHARSFSLYWDELTFLSSHQTLFLFLLCVLCAWWAGECLYASFALLLWLILTSLTISEASSTQLTLAVLFQLLLLLLQSYFLHLSSTNTYTQQ